MQERIRLMSWSIGYDMKWNRDIGYGVPSACDHPECSKEIDRGLAYVCGGEPYGGNDGCGLYFCGDHLSGLPQLCKRCKNGDGPFAAKPDLQQRVDHKMTDPSWAAWREGLDETQNDERGDAK